MSKVRVIKESVGYETESFFPKTSRGRRLLALDKKIIDASTPFLSPEEIDGVLGT